MIAGAAIALATAGAAEAVPQGVVDVQHGGAVDTDGSVGVSRPMFSQALGGHSIVSDACAIKGKGCPPDEPRWVSYTPAGSPRWISATSGVSDDADSALDYDGFQAERVDYDGYQAAAIR